MPKTHSEQVTDTATCIPSTIPILSPSLTDHVKATSEKIIHLLAHKKLPIGPSIKATTKLNLLKLARLLKQDLTPEIELPPLRTSLTSTATSEGSIIITSTQSNSKISKTTSLSSTSEGDTIYHSTSFHKQVYSTCVEHDEVSMEVDVEVFNCIGNKVGYGDIYVSLIIILVQF